jgi:hypothetical protein
LWCPASPPFVVARVNQRLLTGQCALILGLDD